MNAFALMAHHRLYNDYTPYCNELYRVHLGAIISDIEINNDCFDAGNSRSLENSALTRRIDRLFNRFENKKAPLELVNISRQNTRETALVLLNSLYNIERAKIKGTGRSYLNLFPELAQCNHRPEYVNLITFITLGKLSCVLGYAWTHVSERDALSRLDVYISIYYDRLQVSWNPTRQHARDVRTAFSTAVQEVNNTPRMSSTASWGASGPSISAQGVHVVTDIYSDGSYDGVLDNEPLESGNLPRTSVPKY